MTEQLSDLPIADYSSAPREQTRVVWEKAAVRRIDPNDREDIWRVWITDRATGVVEEMIGDPKTVAECVNDARTEPLLFAVSGSRGVKGEEIGELQGWVWFQKDEAERLVRLGKEGLIKEGEGEEVLEVSSARYPKAAGGQMAGGLRQALIQLAEIHSQDGPSLKPNLTITAYVSPRNPDAQRALERAGFVRRGMTVYDPEENNQKDHLYVLDWKVFEAILRQQVDSRIGDLGLKVEGINTEK